MTGTRAPSPSIIRARGLGKTYDTAAGPFRALHDVDLDIGAGELAAIVGRSGSGKSTLLNVFAGIDHPSDGEVVVAGEPVHQLDQDALARWRGRSIGLVFQFFQLLPTLTVAENVALPMDFGGVFAGRQRERAIELLDLVGVADQADKLPTALSGGQQQRAALARALANDPPLILADEPTGNLDTRTADQVMTLFERLVASGKTVVMVTHERDIAARVPRVITLKDGAMIEQERTDA